MFRKKEKQKFKYFSRFIDYFQVLFKTNLVFNDF